MNIKNKKRQNIQVITFITIMVFLLNVSMASALEPFAEVYYRTSGGSGFPDTDNFENDLNAAIETQLTASGIAMKYVNIMDANVEETSAVDLGIWDVYSHNIGWSGLDTSYATSNGILDYSNSNHLQVTNGGLTLNFFGYKDYAYKDFLLYKTPNIGKKVFTFEINEAKIDYHTVDGGGFLFNVASSGGKISGYCVLLGQNDINLYKFDNIAPATIKDETSNVFGNISGVSTVGTPIEKQDVSVHNIKMITTATNVKMWDNGVLIMNRTLTAIPNGESFGPIASYGSHGCSSMSIFTFNNIKMFMADTVPFETALHQILWEMKLKYIINIDDAASYFDNATTKAGIVSDINSNDLKYIALGDTTNQAINTSFISDSISGAGTYVDYSNMTTTNAISSIAAFIVNGISQYKDEILAIEYLESNGIEYATSDSATSVTSDITLLNAKSIDGTSVTSSWTSANTAYVSNTGKVTPPSISTGNVSVVLNEEITGARLTSSAVYTVTVKPRVNLSITSEGTSEVEFAMSSLSGASSVVLKQSTDGAIYTTATTGALSSASTTAKAIGLQSGQKYYFKLLVNGSLYSNIVTSTLQETQTTHPHKTPVVEVIVNGQPQNIGTVNQETTDGVKTVTVDVNEDTVQKLMDEVIAGEDPAIDEERIIEVPVPVTTDNNVNVVLDGDLVQQMEDKEFTFRVTADKVSYSIPAVDINIGEVANELAIESDLSNLKVEIKIVQPDAATIAKIQEQATLDEYEIMIPPVNFEITAINTITNEERSIGTFSNYVQRLFEIPAGMDPNKITTGVVYNKDGTFSHVPTQVIQVGDKFYAKINSLTNSTYTIIWNQVTFTDMENRWAKNAANNMASRLIVNGDGKGNFIPDRAIKRGEFAAIITKALGIYRTGAGVDKYSDVKSENIFYDAISIASDYGLLKGYVDGKFYASKNITREEAMVVFSKAADIAKLKTVSGIKLDSFSDYLTSGKWSRVYIQDNIERGIIVGSKNMINPKANISRAEVVSAVEKLLKNTELINK